MSFDRVAAIYDATRGLPDDVARQVAEGIAAAIDAGPETRILELGVGTGRIALPVASLGYRYTGVDISPAMMDVLRQKAAASGVDLTLIGADVTNLPFPDGSFDAVLAVHVLHLVPDWKKALAEARRVTVPGGCFVLAGNRLAGADPAEAIRRRWREFVREEGSQLRQRYGDYEDVEAELIDQGCYSAVYRVAHWESELRPGELIELQSGRTFSESWDVPVEVLARVRERMMAWAKEQFGDLDHPLTTAQEFNVAVHRWPVS